MISGMRDHVLALACLRHGVPAVQGRGEALLVEIERVDAGRANRLTGPLRELAS
jgi:hypothetical protein